MPHKPRSWKLTCVLQSSKSQTCVKCTFSVTDEALSRKVYRQNLNVQCKKEKKKTRLPPEVALEFFVLLSF